MRGDPLRVLVEEAARPAQHDVEQLLMTTVFGGGEQRLACQRRDRDILEAAPNLFVQRVQHVLFALFVELLRQVDAPLVGTVLNSLSADDSFSGEPYRYEAVSKPARRGSRRPEPDHGENGRRRRRWDDEGAPDVEWDPVASPPARS